MKLLKTLFVILNIMITNAAFGYCFSIENHSDLEIVEAWADVDLAGCQDMRLYPGYWSDCKKFPCGLGCLKRPKIHYRINGQDVWVTYNIFNPTCHDIHISINQRKEVLVDGGSGNIKSFFFNGEAMLR